MGYRIDYCEYFDGDGNYYKQIPTDRLLEVEGSTELVEFKIPNDEKKDEIN